MVNGNCYLGYSGKRYYAKVSEGEMPGFITYTFKKPKQFLTAVGEIRKTKMIIPNGLPKAMLELVK